MSIPELKVLAAGAHEHALKKIVPLFERDHAYAVTLNFGNARAVAATVTSGAKVDVVMTSTQSMAELAAASYTDGASRTRTGWTQIGAAVAKRTAVPNISDVEALKHTLLAAGSIAHIDPNGGGTPGPYFTELLARLGIAQAMHGKIKLCPSGKDVVRAIEAGEVEIGMTQATELLNVASLSFVGFLPAQLQLRTLFEAAIGTQCLSRQGAAEFIGFLSSPAAIEEWSSAGWSVAAGTPG